MLRKINKKYIYIISVLFLTISFIVGFSWINSSFTLASGNITMAAKSCSSTTGLYDKVQCMSSIDSITSRYVNNGVYFNYPTASKSEIENSNYKNGLGVYTLTRTINDEFPVHYYRGDVDDNNVKFGGFCWKIVRTTSTGGTKLVYNGEPKANGNCSDDTADSHIIGTSTFGYANTDYMKDNSTTTNQQINYNSYEMQYAATVTASPFIAAASYSYNPDTNLYTLSNSQQYTWSSDYQSLNNYYTCSFSSTSNSCNRIYYIVRTGATYASAIELRGGDDLTTGDTEIAFGYDYIDNGDGTYTLTGVRHIKKSQWFSYYSLSLNYACPDNSETCSDIQAIYKRDNMEYYYNSVNDPITFGKSVSYNGTEYTLNDTVSVWDFSWQSNHEDDIYDLYNYNYTFYGLNDHSSVYYIKTRNYRPSGASVKMNFTAYTLTNGDLSISRTVNSDIKTMIDDWYNTNLSSVSNKIEDTPYCSDTRSYKKIESNQAYIYSIAEYRTKNYEVDISCNEYDSYTVDSSIGYEHASNTTDSFIGNGLLTYPIGLLTLDEIIMGGMTIYENDNNATYLSMGTNYYLMTPYIINSSMTYAKDNGVSNSIGNIGVRPAISLKNSVQITSGTGTLADPYIVS